MPLFDNLQKHPQLQDQSSFVYLLLKRLALSEIIAANLFIKNVTVTTERELSVPSRIREKCDALPPEGSEHILNILTHIVSIARLIQSEWAIRNQNTPIPTLKENALVLACSITSTSLNEKNLLSNVREHSSNLTDLIIDTLIKPDKIEQLNLEQLDLIEPILVQSFPEIDIAKLKLDLMELRNKIDFLKNNIDSIHYDMIDQDNHSAAWSCRMS